MSTNSAILDIAMRLWPQARDHGTVDDPADLDLLLAVQGRPGAPGYDCGVRGTFGVFAPDQPAGLTLLTGEHAASEEDARFIAHLLVTRTLLAAGLHIDERVTAAMSDTYALSWTARGGGHYRQTPLALALSIWLVALDPLGASDRPLPIDWSPACFQDAGRWDVDYRLFSHYDIRERAIDWGLYVAVDAARHEGVSTWTIVEPLLRLEQDGRVRLVLSQFSERGDRSSNGTPVPAAAMLERGRIARLLQDYLESVQRGGRGPSGPRIA
ncbi:MAG: hypothetical protein GEU80_10140 [Dehalococcoidia bacterium]|nr:hypothetical protein [Dehalococcoidia bacterium]